MVTPVVDTYSTAVGDLVCSAGILTASVNAAFVDGEASDYDLSGDVPAGSGLSTVDTLPAGFTLKPLSHILSYDGTPGSTSKTIDIVANPAMPKFTIQSDTHTAGTLIPCMVGCVFPKGALASDPVGTSNGQTFVTLVHWSDGSPKHGFAMGVFPVGTEITLTDVPTTGSLMTEADILAAAPTADVSITLGATPYTQSLTPLLADPQKLLDVPYSSTEMVQARYREQFGASGVWVIFTVTLFKSGDMSVKAQFEEPEMIRVWDTYGNSISGTITLAGQVFTLASYVLSRNEKFETNELGQRFIGWVGATQYDWYPDIDAAQWRAARILPNPGLIETTEAALDAMVDNYSLGQNRNHRSNWGNAGYHQGLAPLAGWECKWAKTGDWRALRATLANDQAVARWPLTWREPGGRIMNPNDNILGNYRSTDGVLYNETGGTNVFRNHRDLPDEIIWDYAHTPPTGVRSYLVFGDLFYRELMEGHCACYYQASRTDSWGDGTNRTWRGQVRATAWAFKQVGAAAAFLPDTHPNKLPLQDWLYANVNYFSQMTVENPGVGPDSGLGYPYCFGDGGGSTQTWDSPWMHMFWAMTNGLLMDIEPLTDPAQKSKFTELARWQTRAVEGYLGSAATHCFGRTGAYRIPVLDSKLPAQVLNPAQNLFATWDEVWHESWGDPGPACGGDIENSSAFHYQQNYDQLDGTFEEKNVAISWAGLMYSYNVFPSNVQGAYDRYTGAGNASVLTGGDWNSSPYGMLINEPVVTNSKAVNITVTSNQVLDDVDANFNWTPTRDGNGNVVDGSIAGLPLDQWVRVADVTPASFEALHTAETGMNWGAHVWSQNSSGGRYSQAMVAWASGDLDEDLDTFWRCWNGGHGNSTFNGVSGLDLNKMDWVLGLPMTDTLHPTVPWDRDYFTSGSYWIYNTSYDNDPVGSKYDTAPDGDNPYGRTSTSRHGYCGYVYDSQRKRMVTTRGCAWAWNTPLAVSEPGIKKTFGSQANGVYTRSGSEYWGYFYHNMWYDKVNDKYIGTMNLQYANRSWVGVNPDTAVVTDYPDDGNIDTNGGHCTCRIGDDKILVRWMNGSKQDRYGIWNCNTESWDKKSHGVTNPLAYTEAGYVHDMQGLCDVPDWGNTALMRTEGGALQGKWWRFNHNTGTNEAWTPGGYQIPTTYDNVGKGLFYWPKKKLVVLHATTGANTDSALFVMRTG